ncbi:MAG TPA: FHA domain-containing protein [Ktedonobacterales bacterium]|nr:FHA domain-containing protein [Ktedonobacterales bacterium]
MPQQPAWGADPAGASPGAGWRNGPAPDQAPAGPAVRTDSRTAYIIIREGKEPGRTFELRKERMSIGRSRESEIFLEDLAVSRLHASIYRDDQGSYILRDENSANGTTVNGQRISEHRLVEGDEIQVGQTIMTFTRR